MPLSMARAGESNVIRKVGGTQETKRFFGNLRICDRWFCDGCVRNKW